MCLPFNKQIFNWELGINYKMPIVSCSVPCGGVEVIKVGDPQPSKETGDNQNGEVVVVDEDEDEDEDLLFGKKLRKETNHVSEDRVHDSNWNDVVDEDEDEDEDLLFGKTQKLRKETNHVSEDRVHDSNRNDVVDEDEDEDEDLLFGKTQKLQKGTNHVAEDRVHDSNRNDAIHFVVSPTSKDSDDDLSIIGSVSFPLVERKQSNSKRVRRKPARKTQSDMKSFLTK